VTSVFVVEDERRQGIGALILHELEAIATDRGLSALRLDTRHDLVKARR
jgi:GNAT superfamily N-acetyltransferase